MQKLRGAMFVALAAIALLASQAYGSEMACDAAPVTLTAFASEVTSTNIDLLEGESAYVLAYGSWRSCVGSTTCVAGPDGGNFYNPTSKVPTARNHALVGSMDGGATWFQVGASQEVIGPGTLVLAINDSNDDPSDNKGELNIMVFPVPCKKEIRCDTSPQNFTVLAEIEHLRTGFILLPGVSVNIVASGTWKMCKADDCASGPEGHVLGDRPVSGSTRLFSAPSNSLVGSLDNGRTWFHIGAEKVVSGPGELILANNDVSDLQTDNSGQVEVSLTPNCASTADWSPYAMGGEHQACLRTVCGLPDGWYSKPAGQAYGTANKACLPCLWADRKVCSVCYEDGMVCAFDDANVSFYCTAPATRRSD